MDRSVGRATPSAHVRTEPALREYRPFPTTTEDGGTMYEVTLIPGDGVGPELTEATRRVLEATGVEFAWDLQEAGAAALERTGSPLPDAVLESIRKNGVAQKG